MVETLVIWIRVQIGQCLAVQRGIAQSDNNLRFYVLLTFVVPIEWVLQIFGHSIVERFRQNPFYRGFLTSLKIENEKSVLIKNNTRIENNRVVYKQCINLKFSIKNFDIHTMLSTAHDNIPLRLCL